MPLQLTGTWEHAILVAIARIAEESADTGFLNRTAFQKVVYFLQLSGVPTKYRFVSYYDGPLCERIPQDIEWLVADEVIRDSSSDSDRSSNYRPGTAADDLLLSHADRLKIHQPTINKVVQAVLPLEFSHLEVLTTINYLYRQLKAGGGPGPWKDRVIERFMQVKKEKFERTNVSDSYDSMVRANLLEA